MQDVIILGTGPAGLAAAIYTARADMSPILFEGPEPGGQLATTTEVENYPGAPEGVMGPELIDLCKEQAKRFGADLRTETVESVDLSQRPFTVRTDKETYQCKALIVATGATARKLDIPSEKKYWGYGVSSCATCDGFFFRDKEVIVVGGGDSAMEESNFLTRFAKKVHVVHRRDELRASHIMAQRAQENPKISFIWDTVVSEVLGEGDNPPRVTGARLKNVKTDEETEMAIDGVFLAIGHTPNVDIFDGALDLDEDGFIRVEHPSTRTNIEGVFACGDVMDPHYKQAVTAAGTGCKAALDAERFLESQK